jgi:outer membrane immunogenic protein
MKIALSAAALIASSIGAIAADLPSRAEAPAPLPPSSSRTPMFASDASDWSGLYAGGAIVGSRSTGKISLSGASYPLPAVGADIGANTNTLGLFNDKNGGNTFGGSLFGGYNVQVDSFVYGVEADLTYSLDRSKSRTGSLNVNGAYTDADTVQPGDTVDAIGPLAISHRSRMNWDGSLRARFGMVAAPSLLVFATGGVAAGRIQQRTGINGAVVFTDDQNTTQATHNVSGSSESNKIRLGWTLGAGADYKLTESWTMRAEYRYTSFGKSSSSASSTASCVDGPATGDGCTQLAVATASASTKTTDAFHAVRIGLSYKFGADILPTTIFARY